ALHHRDGGVPRLAPRPGPGLPPPLRPALPGDGAARGHRAGRARRARRGGDHGGDPRPGALMDVVCVGGGPGGLLLGILLRLRDPAHRVTVLERNRSDDAFGFGVVFSDETLANIRSADPVSLGRIKSEFRSWPDIDIVYRGRVVRSGGHGFAAIARRRLLGILTERAEELGVEVRHGSEVRDLEALCATHDLVVGADGANSLVRRLCAAALAPRPRPASPGTSGWGPRSRSSASPSSSPRRSGG